MKKIFLILFGLALYSIALGQAVTYTCPMHPEIHANKPGNCPKCGMKLVREKAKPVKKPSVKKPVEKSVPKDTANPNHPVMPKDSGMQTDSMKKNEVDMQAGMEE